MFILSTGITMASTAKVFGFFAKFINISVNQPIG